MQLSGCVIRNADGELLLLHRNKGPLQQWELPGGKVEDGESAEVAAVREILEELGTKVTLVKDLGEATFQMGDIDCRYRWYEARLDEPKAGPCICEPQTFDDLRYWGVEMLKGRPDLSANVKNLLNSSVFAG